MVQNRPILDAISHLVLIFGIIIVALPIWITFVAATHDPIRMTQAPIPLMPGTYFWGKFCNNTLWQAVYRAVEAHLFGGCYSTH